MDYKIIHADAVTGQIEVLYTHEGRSVGVYAIDVPIVDGAYLSVDALREEILHRAPLWVLDRERDVASATGFAAIEALVEPKTLTDESSTANEMWAEIAFEKAVANTLVKFGVLEALPTSIPITEL